MKKNYFLVLCLVATAFFIFGCATSHRKDAVGLEDEESYWIWRDPIDYVLYEFAGFSTEEQFDEWFPHFLSSKAQLSKDEALNIYKQSKAYPFKLEENVNFAITSEMETNKYQYAAYFYMDDIAGFVVNIFFRDNENYYKKSLAIHTENITLLYKTADELK